MPADTMDSQASPPRIHRQTLVEMNRPVFTARRDAAHKRIQEILGQDITVSDKAERAQRYTACLRLTEETLRSTRRSQIAQDSPLIHYFKLLRETLKAQVALVNHELSLVNEAREFSRILGEERVAQLQTAKALFSDSEHYVLSSLRKVVEFGEPLREQDTNERKRTFSDDDWRRYQHATEEYTTLYSAFAC